MSGPKHPIRRSNPLPSPAGSCRARLGGAPVSRARARPFRWYLAQALGRSVGFSRKGSAGLLVSRARARPFRWFLAQALGRSAGFSRKRSKRAEKLQGARLVLLCGSGEGPHVQALW